MLNILIKGTGMVLIVFTGVCWGMFFGSREVRRLEILKEMIRYLQAVRNELHFRNAKTETVLTSAQRIAALENLPLMFSDVLLKENFRNAFEAAMSHTKAAVRYDVKPAEWLLFRSALETVGKFPAEETERYLDAAARELCEIIDALRDTAQQKRKLYRIIGGSLGTAIALMLL